jgi:hypothetical protein
MLRLVDNVFPSLACSYHKTRYQHYSYIQPEQEALC